MVYEYINIRQCLVLLRRAVEVGLWVWSSEESVPISNQIWKKGKLEVEYKTVVPLTFRLIIIHLSLVWRTLWTPGKVRHLSNVRRILLYHDTHMRRTSDGLLADNDCTSVKIMTHHLLILTVLWRTSVKIMTHHLLILTVLLTHVRHYQKFKIREYVFPDLRSLKLSFQSLKCS